MATKDMATWTKLVIGLLTTTAIAAVGWSITAYTCMSGDITDLKVDMAIVKTKVESIQKHTQPYVAKGDVACKGDKE